MSGPIVRTGATPEYWSNWDNVFGGSKPKKAKKKSAGKKAVAKKAAKAGKKAAKKKAKKKR